MNKHKPEPIILPGARPVLELMENFPEQVFRVYCRKNWHGKNIPEIEELSKNKNIPLEKTDISTLDSLCKSSHTLAHQGVVALIKPPRTYEFADLQSLLEKSPLKLVLALDQIQDSGNLGTLSRTAYALGCAALLLPEHNSASFSPGAFKSSAGAINLLPVISVGNLARALDAAEEMGFYICAACRGVNSLNAFEFEWQTPSIIVLGNEHKGIRTGVLKRCAYHIAIPFGRPFDSLNISQAGAILIGLFAAATEKNHADKIEK